MGRAQIRSKKPHSTTPAAATTTSTPRPSTLPLKKSLRLARSRNFVSKIEKSAAKPTGKTRRRKAAASSALATTLDALADALPDTAGVNIVSGSGAGAGTGPGAGAGTGRVIKSRPGAQKRKEKMIRNEGVRFGMNMAILETVGQEKEGGEGDKGKVVKSRWEMLRGFIGQTLERKEEFVQQREQGEGGSMEIE